jgi:predicted Zn-dependent protease
MASHENACLAGIRNGQRREVRVLLKATARSKFGRLKIALLALMLSGCQGVYYALPQVTADEVAAANAQIDSAPPLATVRRDANEAIELVNKIGWTLKDVAGPICAQASSDTCTFNFSYKSDSQVNAWASGERDITITSALLRYLLNNDEVAAALAHEMGHHIAGHLDKDRVNTISGGVIGGVLLGALVAATGGDQTAVNQAMGMGVAYGAAIGRLSFSKEQEREADYLGAYLMARAGYDLENGGKLWVRLAKQPESSRETDLFDTHPSGGDRMAAWKLTIEEIKASPDLMPHWGD